MDERQAVGLVDGRNDARWRVPGRSQPVEIARLIAKDAWIACVEALARYSVGIPSGADAVVGYSGYDAKFAGRVFGFVNLYKSMLGIFTWLALTGVLEVINVTARIGILLRRFAHIVVDP